MTNYRSHLQVHGYCRPHRVLKVCGPALIPEVQRLTLMCGRLTLKTLFENGLLSSLNSTWGLGYPNENYLQYV